MIRILVRVFSLCVLGLAVAPRLEAGMVLTGKLFDGEASAKSIFDAMRQGQQFSPSLKVPLAGQEVAIDLIIDLFDPQGDAHAAEKAGRSWKTTTDGAGGFSLDTGLERWPERALIVASANREGRRLYSTYLKTAAGPQDVHVYPLTESSARITADVKVAYDLQESAGAKRLRIRVGVRIMNRGGEMYVGRKAAGSAWREIWRIPLPQGAVISSQSGPYPGVAGWRPTADGRNLVLDTPVPGICDIDFANLESFTKEFWVVELVVPARQTFVQSFSVPTPVEQRAFTVWCTHENMSLSSPQLLNNDSREPRDPFSGEDRNQEVIFSNEPLKSGIPVVVLLNADNVAIGQAVSLKALKWVGGFVLVVVLSLLLGLALGPKGPSAEALLESLSGEELLDRVADLDARFARGKIPERDYKRLREPLVALAAEEVFAAQPQPAGEGTAVMLPQGAREILRRIDEIEKSGKMDPALAAERAHLLEALARAIPREASRG